MVHQNKVPKLACRHRNKPKPSVVTYIEWGMARCKVCKFVETGFVFVRNVEKRSFHINHSSDCDSYRAVYLITCKRCGNDVWGALQHHSG